MDTIRISSQLTIEDWRAIQAQCSARLQAGQSQQAQWVKILTTTAVIGIVVVLTAGPLTLRVLDPLSLLAGVAIIWLAIGANGWFARRRSVPDEKGTFLGPCDFELGAEGLRTVRPGRTSSFASWVTVIDVTFTATHVFLWVDRFAAYVLPGRDLPDGLTPQQLFDWIAAARTRAATAAAAEPSSPASPAEQQPSPQVAAATTEVPAERRRGTWLRDLASLIALRGTPVLTEATHALSATLMTLLAVGLWVAFDRWQYGPDAEFYVYGLSDLAWYLLGGLAVAWVLARTSFPRIALPRAIVVCSLGASLAILYFNLEFFVQSRWFSIALSAVAVLYAFVYFGGAARALTGQHQPRAAIAAFVSLVAFFWVTDAMWVYPTVWTPSEEQYEEDSAGSDDVEPLFFKQRDRIDTALAAIPPGNPAATELYFVGFAGVGDEKVFAEEIKFAARAVEDRYSNDAGSVLLLNDVRDFESAPLATATTLEYALRGVAAKMQTDDDVLFLALASHGSRDWTLSVSNGGLPLTDISAEELAAALDAADIKWRVIVISACFAGGFIDALQDPHTIVIAAAAPDRTSFGCSNERDLTYFGEAFYRDALPKTRSLRDAFAVAEQRILFRESPEGIEPSHPMAFFGAELEHKLAALR